MVEQKKAVRKPAGDKAAKSSATESAVWPFAVAEKAEKPVKSATKAAAAKSVKKEGAAEKSAAKPAAKSAAKPAAKPAAKKSAKAQAAAQPSAQERYRMVETAAYYIAERSGFQGCTTDHWAAAEIEIAKKLGG